MTAADTIEIAQVSVDQIQRGLDFAQNRIDNADALVEVAERVTDVAADVVVQARGLSRRMLICGALALVAGIAAIVIIKKRKQANASQESEETLT